MKSLYTRPSNDRLDIRFLEREVMLMARHAASPEEASEIMRKAADRGIIPARNRALAFTTD